MITKLYNHTVPSSSNNNVGVGGALVETYQYQHLYSPALLNVTDQQYAEEKPQCQTYVRQVILGRNTRLQSD
jgi:hypothetical protein